MFRRNAYLMISFSSLIAASTAHAATNGSSTNPSQGSPDIKFNIQSDTHHVYPGEAQSSGPQSDDNATLSDRQIQTEVLGLIKNKFNRYNLSVSIDQGTVILNGYVDNEETKRNIENDIRKIQGVKNVMNLIQVKGEM